MVEFNPLKLLRVIPMPLQRERQGDEEIWEPRTIQYLKLTKNYFDTINTPLGDLVPFNYGKCLLVLHFRKIY